MRKSVKVTMLQNVGVGTIVLEEEDKSGTLMHRHWYSNNQLIKITQKTNETATYYMKLQDL